MNTSCRRPFRRTRSFATATNLHIIPADAAIARVCKSLRRGELIRLEGQLVEATGPEIGTWRSSLRRDDTGKGACELLLVESVAKPERAGVRSVAVAAQ